MIRDRSGQKHSFAGNITTIEIDPVKNDVLLVEGEIVRFQQQFLDTHVSLAPTQVSLLVGWSYFRISNLSASLVALHEKLKREDPNYFSILGLGKIS